VRYLQAALDAEAKHARLLAQAGASSAATTFYLPAGVSLRLGRPDDPASFLGALEAVETLLVGLYVAAVAQFWRAHASALGQLTAKVLGVEAEHRMLGRVIGDVLPANNLTLERQPFAAVSDAGAALRPYLTGKPAAGATSGPLRSHTLPGEAAIKKVVGRYGTRVVRKFV
jgi:hypothetical protein